MMMTTAINKPDFSTCPKKHRARKRTIIDMYRRYFAHSLPEDRQYWTMCGPHTNNGIFQNGSELGQLLKSKLITPDQFYGVDIEEEIIDQNRAAMPEINWIHNDFIRAMRVARKKDDFRPAVINADFISLRERGSVTTSAIMAFIEYLDIPDVLLVSNIMLTNPHAVGGVKTEDLDIDGDAVISMFEKWADFQYAWNTFNWRIHPHYYVYNGTGKQSRTIMGTFIFTRKGKAT